MSISPNHQHAESIEEAARALTSVAVAHEARARKMRVLAKDLRENPNQYVRNGVRMRVMDLFNTSDWVSPATTALREVDEADKILREHRAEQARKDIAAAEQVGK